MNIQKDLVTYMTSAFNTKSTTLSKDIKYSDSYIFTEHGLEFQNQVNDPNNPYSKLDEEFTPIVYSDFTGTISPIPNINTQLGSISVSLVIREEELQDNLDILSAVLLDFPGKSDTINNIKYGFNVSTFNRFEAPDEMNGIMRIILTFTLYFVATENALLGNNMKYEFKLSGGSFERVYPLQVNTGRDFPMEPVQKVNTIENKHTARESVHRVSFSTIYDENNGFHNWLIDTLENPTNLQNVVEYKKTYGTSTPKVFTQNVIISNVSITESPGNMLIIGFELGRTDL